MIGIFLLSLLILAPGDYPADVVRVIDGDTVAVNVRVWPSVLIETSIRVLGVDTPELRGKCESEREKAREARSFVRKLLPAGSKIVLKKVKPDKYAGRHDAEIWLADGRSLAELLIGAKLAREYHGEARQTWCEVIEN